MEEYFVPTENAETEFTEKRSRFIGRIQKIRSEEQATELLREIRAMHRDATHNVYAYILRENGITRYSDDGEPQGTAGMPVLEVLRREGVFDVLCVVTRYFGGTLLGAGGLTRAYARSAKLTLDRAGISVMRLWLRETIRCPYPLLERIRLEITAAEGAQEEIRYGAEVEIQALLPRERAEEFHRRISEISAGRVIPREEDEVFRPAPLRAGTDSGR